ncbi:Hsp20/alpha crystallin family protein [Bernardetia sp.]|uniref:Hsp20/alpha crystallin family protein n=1 Tax=Bernardetia sp. TaxID=1937974 RepID=UPI0025C2D061|nr:Hsp20/alpha crystallin family protein [Bernardetia sp.]
MTLIKYRPSNSFLPSAFSEFFEQDFLPSNRSLFGADLQMPAVNISENENEHLIEVSAAGFEKDQFNIEMEDNKLTISAEMKEEHEEKSDENVTENKKQNYYTRREFRSSSFKRSFTLPKNVDGENISASYENGILKLILPKKAEVINKKKVNIS